MTVSLTKSKPIDYQQEVPEDTQLYCIDLPGETVECYVHKPKLKVVLRKHRDVIFDLKLGSAKQYKVYATQADFYNVRDKKLVEFERKQSVSFKDGERMHVWVSREFKGELVLESGGKTMMRVDPKRWDGNRYDENPKTKPAPIIIALNANAVPGQAAISPAEVKPLAMQSASSSNHTNSQPVEHMHVIEVHPDDNTLPQQIISFIKHGGDKITAIDPFEIATRNWIANQVAASLGVAFDAREWLGELWNSKLYFKKTIHKSGKTAYYLIFKGYAGMRKYFTAARFGVMNAKVLQLTGGVGSASGVVHAGWNSVKDLAKGKAKGTAAAIVFTIGIDVAEWWDDHFTVDKKTGKPKQDMLDLFVKILIDLLKFVVSAVVAAALMAVLAFFFTAAASGAVLVVGLFGFAVGAAYLIDLADDKSGASKAINKAAHQAYDFVAAQAENAYQYLEHKMPKDYEGFNSAMKSLFE